ncbi:ABC transporter transmembrane domain-containing protein [Thalassococcus sp. S3]|uniref:ABC transporter transmembrane domain-containing protein n=1 Tax=Thalassococcus sp. S3 TaxID=2017482 RepID=UPI001024837C|nr:ABC transporter transmembrane domain-containing protein [Thalassococcus sp. S3]QBF30702.1 ABC transporter ATP-binding protein [Thalassococcus sp. S3]
MLLLVTSLLFPLLYLTLELPKRIINDAIDAPETPIRVYGMEFEQVQFLAILCGGFLIAVLAHGLLKMRINTMKGVLAERLLRRFRYTLIARILRFPQPYFERTSQGELVSMVTSEAEPMGGLMGDAIAQPVLQAGQMLTILTFLFLQSFWFGLAACALIPLQAWLIPKLQRQINLLNKKRVIQVRGLAAEIGESAAGAAALRTNGGWRYRLAMITDRLGHLFEIRFEIYQKKFFMKFLNNFITQLTPFFFFSVGGYLVIQGSVTLGALVAALAAYKDLSSPWKELLAYYNQVQDMSLRWEIIIERFAPDGMVDEALFKGVEEDAPRLNGDIVLDGVTVRDADGNAVLEDINVTLPKQTVVGIAAPSEEDRRAMAEVLTREVTPSSGKVLVAGHEMSGLHQSVIAARIGHATGRPILFQGTFADNMMMPLKTGPRPDSVDPASIVEAERAGNSIDALQAEWLDPARAGAADVAELRAWWISLLDGIGTGTALFRRGLDQRFDPKAHPELAEHLVALRGKVKDAVAAAGLSRHVYRFEDDRYNPALPVADNLIFATPLRPITEEVLANETEFMDFLRALELDEDLLGLTREVVELLRQIFGLDGTDHPLFRKLGLEVQTYERAVELLGKGNPKGASDKELALLMTIPFRISAEQIGPAFPEEMKTRLLELRAAHSAELREALAEVYTPLEPDLFVPGLTVLENALFGKISDAAGAKADELRKIVADILVEEGLKSLVIQLIYDMPIALGGANLPALFAEPLSFCRATIKRPDILILDGALVRFEPDVEGSVHENLRRLLPETTLIYLASGFEDPEGFDTYIEIQQGRIIRDEREAEETTDSAASADLARKLRALEQTPLFSGLNRRQLRLLAFGARWYRAPAGEYVFYKDDDPSDGAYMVLEGEAGLYLPKPDTEDEMIAKVGPGTLVGELGLIRNVPRALDMKAETDLMCLRIGAEEFLAVVENDAATAFKVLQVVAGYVSN